MPTTKAKKRSSRDLEVWKEAINLVKKLYTITDKFPPSGNFGLTKQIREAVVSRPANIAAEQGRNSAKGFREFLAVSLDSLAELETQLKIAKEIKCLTHEDLNPWGDALDRIRKMIKSRSQGIK